MYNRTEIYFTNHRFFKLLLLKNVFPRIPRYYRLIYARVGEKEAWRILLIIFSICIIIVAVQWWWWWCSRDSDSSRWIELFALLKIVEERRRSWWGWWLNLLSSYSGSSVSRWRRLRSKALSLRRSFSPLLSLFTFSLSFSFSFSFFRSGLSKFSQLGQHEESTWAQKAPEYLCHGKESRDLDCVPQAASPRHVQMLEIFAFWIRESKRRPIATS